MFRQAGLDVISGQVILAAKNESVTFRGDEDSDVEVALSTDANGGDTSIQVDLNDEAHSIATSDYILNKNGDTHFLQVVDRSW